MNEIVAGESKWIICAGCGTAWPYTTEVEQQDTRNHIHAFQVTYCATSADFERHTVRFCHERCQQRYETAHPGLTVYFFNWLW